MSHERHSYHDTTHVDRESCERYEAAALAQEEAIHRHFRRVRLHLTPEDIHRDVLPNAPLTSVRRAITNLANAGVLEKTDEQVRGMYGRPIYRWKLVPTAPATSDWINATSLPPKQSDDALE